MIITHLGIKPTIDNTAYIAPNAVICGDVTVGKNVRVMFGAQIIAENHKVEIGDNCIILENAVIRAAAYGPTKIGQNCLIGPHCHLVSCTIGERVFVATGASIFHGAVLENGVEVRINGVVHIKTVLAENSTVPISWIAVGNPAQLFPPEKHDEIWALQKELHFVSEVYGVSNIAGHEVMPAICQTMADRLSTHQSDTIV